MSWYKGYKQEWKEIIETVSREVNRTPQMRGIQLILSVDPDTHKFVTGQISRTMIAVALESAQQI